MKGKAALIHLFIRHTNLREMDADDEIFVTS